MACRPEADESHMNDGVDDLVAGDAGVAIGDVCLRDDGDLPRIAPEVDTSLDCVEDETDVPGRLFTNDVGELPPEYAALHALCARMDPAQETRDDLADPALAADLRTFFRSLLARPALARALSGLPSDPEARVEALSRIWLAKNGFEHVLCGERNTNGSVGGLHLWSELYFAEREGRANYRCRRGVSDPAVLAIRFDWQPPGRTDFARKPLGSMVPGMSPACMLAVGYVALSSRASADKNSSFTASLYGASRQWILSTDDDAIFSVYPTAQAP
jgi:hypothetical protein